MASDEALPAPPLGYPPLATDVMVPTLGNDDSGTAMMTEPSASDRRVQQFTDSPFVPLVEAPTPEHEAINPPSDVTGVTPPPDPGPTVVEAPPEPIEPPPLTTLEVTLDWYPGPQHAALFVAQARGLYEQRGLSVIVSTPADPDVPLKLLAAGRVELALSHQPLLHHEVDRGLPLIRVATLIGTPLAGLVLREDLDIDSPAELAGLRIGYATQDGLGILLSSLLRQYDIRRDELKVQGVDFELDDVMSAREVDGVIGSMRHLLPRQLADEGMATRVLRVEDHGVPLHDGLILVANRDRLGKNRAAIRLLVEALEEATAWIIEYPDDAWELLAGVEPGLDSPSSRAAWSDTLARFSARPAALDHGRYARFEAFLHKNAMVDTLTPVERLAVDLGAP
ncbi:ABC transporter substrate-binding protein [Halomonas sp. TRM85114]|uniref:ABC transporter substrate-binding protein n=1 Tax=Halomonas jincaotanensis TaxID=2810616 RepID=UPI001BD68C27|nr:ABC transporter substrate-binding protein [Halomonas jincaotanensis]MBS9402528.1 ABC transporter substrate-binding protein [Halomonas jincaotanensis]